MRTALVSRRLMGLALILVIVASVRLFLTVGPPADASSVYLAHQSDFRTPSSTRLASVRDWHFVGAVPSGWSLERGASSEADGGATYVRTAMLPAAPQLASPAFTVKPGRYQVLVEGQVFVGGMRLRAVDAASGAALGSSRYSDLQVFGPAPMVINVRVGRSTSRMRIVFASWSPFPNACAWILQRVTVVRG
jgi:hypothetical protein